MDLVIRFSEEKNQLLKSIRGIGFVEILEFMREGNVLDDLKHPDPKRNSQRIYLVKINKYVYVVPYVINVRNKEIFLKTIYSSRKYTKLYLKGEKS